MRSHKFIDSLLYLIIQLVAKESRANENNGGIRCFFVLFIDKRYISQVIHFNPGKVENYRIFAKKWQNFSILQFFFVE